MYVKIITVTQYKLSDLYLAVTPQIKNKHKLTARYQN